MAKVKNFGGFDVSKKFFDVCVLEAGQERVHRFSNDSAGLAAVVKWLSNDTQCVMEATGPYYLQLACYLHRHGFEVSVINPLVIRRFCQMRMLRAKTDKADARMIALYGQRELPTLWEPPSQYTVTLQQLDALSQQLQKQQTALRNQLESFEASGMMEKSTRLKLKKLVAHLEKELQQLAKDTDKILVTYHQEMLANLLTIPGLGKKTATVLIMITGGFSRFSNYKQLSAYVGLSPRIYESGSSVRGKARICKMGMGRIRALLYLCSWSAKRCNQSCQLLYDRLVAKGKSKRLALIAVANKLIKQAFAIATTQTVYDKNYLNNSCF